MKRVTILVLIYFLSLLSGCSSKEETSFLLKCDGILHSVTKNISLDRTEYFQFNNKKLGSGVCSKWNEKEISCLEEIDDSYTKLVLFDRRTGEVIVTETNFNDKYKNTLAFGIHRFVGKCQKVDKKF